MRTRSPGTCDFDTPRFSRLGALSCRYAGATPENQHLVCDNKLNTDIKKTVANIDKLRAEIDAIVAEIEA